MDSKKSLVSATVALCLIGASSVHADTPYPVYPKTTPAEHFSSQVNANVQKVAGTCNTSDHTKIRQSLYVNIPGYYVRLDNTLEGRMCSSYTFPVRVGRHWTNHTDGKTKLMETPVGTSRIIWKNFSVRFDRPRTHSTTYTPEGKRIRIPMPLKWMRSFLIRTKPENSNEYVFNCILHSTTDAYTIGTPASHCCIGLNIDDMLALYGLVLPEQKNGEPKREVPITLEYKVVEMEGKNVVLHADIYEKNPDYSAKIHDELRRLGYADDNIDQGKIDAALQLSKNQFNASYEKIRKKLLTGDFITQQDKEGLHKKIAAQDLLKK
ncbi:L,D-transpeptidase [Candidatus Woesearchaeota archaeon]|nr:L,D-transpeptidase [Candidatus Woesearchaeota archaeon]